MVFDDVPVSLTLLIAIKNPAFALSPLDIRCVLPLKQTDPTMSLLTLSLPAGFSLHEGTPADLSDMMKVMEIAFENDGPNRVVTKDVVRTEDIHPYMVEHYAPRWALPDIKVWKVVEDESGYVHVFHIFQFPLLFYHVFLLPSFLRTSFQTNQYQQNGRMGSRPTTMEYHTRDDPRDNWVSEGTSQSPRRRYTRRREH